MENEKDFEAVWTICGQKEGDQFWQFCMDVFYRQYLTKFTYTVTQPKNTQTPQPKNTKYRPISTIYKLNFSVLVEASQTS